jgi:hypothetical protein
MYTILKPEIIERIKEPKILYELTTIAGKSISSGERWLTEARKGNTTPFVLPHIQREIKRLLNIPAKEEIILIIEETHLHE